MSDANTERPDPNTDAPVVRTGGDSVHGLASRAHDSENDPVMLTADGVDDEPGGSGSATRCRACTKW